MTDYRDILTAAGFPPEVLVIDFETYFDKTYNLSKLSTVEYVMDPRFEVLGMGTEKLNGGSHTCRDFVKPWWVKDVLRLMVDCDKYTLVGQHLQFDALILREKYGITPKFTVDILDLARHLDARDRHSLDHLAKKYNAPTPKGDTSQFGGLHWSEMTPEQRTALADYCLNDVAIETYLLQTLLPRLTNPTMELRLAAHTLRNFLVPSIKIDADLGRSLVTDMQAELQKTVDVVNDLGVCVSEPCKITSRTSRPPRVRSVTAEDISKDGTFLSLLRGALPVGEEIPMKYGKPKADGTPRQIPALAKTDTELDKLLSHSCPSVRALMEARKATDSWPSHISRVQRLLSQSHARGGYMGAPLTYYGAHTGRFSGRDGTNWQNFGARETIHPLVLKVGQMLTAPDGYVFATGDLSQIEARVVAWLSGQDDLVAGFARNEDVYSRFAQESVFHAEVRKPKPEDDPALASKLRVRRAFGKMTILACGFGMGAETFMARCQGDKDLRPSFDSGEYDVRFCRRIVDLYRNRYPKIVSYWREIEKAWRYVAQYKSKTAVVSHNDNTIRFWSEGTTVVIALPSGRCLFYPHASVSADGRCRYHWSALWGGAIVENIVQAVARDVFCEGLLRLEDAGYKVLFHIHDQAIVLLHNSSIEDLAPVHLGEIHRLQCVLPSWADGLPVSVEGSLCSRFHKESL